MTHVTLRVGLPVIAAASAAILAIGGCAASSSHSKPTTQIAAVAPAPVPAAAPTSVPAGPTTVPQTPAPDPKASTALEDIAPQLTLKPAATAEGPAPKAAMQFYARARIAALDNQRYTAINFLEKAIALDPKSYELRYTLARLYQGNASYEDRSIAALEEASTIEPDHLESLTNLGRQYLAKGDTSAGVSTLRLALKTRQYAHDGAGAAIVDFFLGNALRQQGYDRAALTLFERLSVRLRNAGFEIRSTPELALLASHPEVIDAQVGELQQKTGHYADALATFERAAAADPSNLELQGRIVRVLLQMHQTDDATTRAAALVVKQQASPESLAVLRDVCKARGPETDLADELGRLSHQHPASLPLLYAQLDLLQSQGRLDDADRVLGEASAHRPDDFELIGRRFRLMLSRGQRTQAAQFLIESVARQPDWSADATRLMSDLVRPGAVNRLRLADLKAVTVAPAAEASKMLWLERTAGLWHRDEVARDAIDRGLKLRPPFGPLWRDQLEEIWAQGDLTDDQKNEASDALIGEAKSAGAAGLSKELHALQLLRQKRAADAAAEFGESIRLGHKGPDVLLGQAVALRSANDDRAFESTLWKLVSDWPSFREAYLQLYEFYVGRGSDAQAQRVLSTWLAADPSSVLARRIQAREYYHAGRTEAAENILLRMFNERPDDPEVLVAVQALFVQTNRVDELTRKLQRTTTDRPGNLAAVSVLVDQYLAKHKPADAVTLLNTTRTAVADDPDLLYTLSTQFQRVGQKDVSEQVLRDVLRLEPAHPGASNDLGYFLAEGGKDLGNAETLIRRAVSAEPHNTSFLDSLGWVLYKRGRFAEARKMLEQAVGPTGDADAVVLDHLGDTLYRLGESEAAGRTWKKAQERLKVTDGAATDADDTASAGDDERKVLRAQLKLKTTELQSGKPANVAPVNEPQPTGETQAQNNK